MIAVFKPAGVSTQSDINGEPSLFDQTKTWLKQKYAKPGNVFLGIVHRLDKPVEGIVIFAKTSKAASRLSGSFRDRKVKKAYVARVEGCPKPLSATVVDQLVWEEKDRRARVTDDAEAGKRASLEYHVIDEGITQSLVAITLHTGRKHQIRAQLAHRGNPVVGDRKYGAHSPWRPGTIALLAQKITFPHPVKREPITVEVAEEVSEEAFSV